MAPHMISPEADSASGDKIEEQMEYYTSGNGRPLIPQRPHFPVHHGLAFPDVDLIEMLSNFNRERIPERVVHAKGAGAFGELEVTHDISDICSVDMLLGIGKKTPCVVRFSTTAGERGSSDGARDPRGMSLKFFTEQGNWDWVYNNVPFFFIRDPVKFTSLMHATKRNPATNLRDPNAFWGWVVENLESLHMVFWMFSEYGTFKSYRHMNSYMGHAYRWTMPDGSFKYVHMFLQSDQGHRWKEDADTDLNDDDYASRDIYEAIERGEHPTWTAMVQVVDPDDLAKIGFNIFDMTKHWDTGIYTQNLGVFKPRPFGKLTLNRNPTDYFAEVEQVAFSPANLVPGIEPGPDPILQARLFAYPDAQRYRLGVNYQQLPVNRPVKMHNPHFRDGAAYGPVVNGTSSNSRRSTKTPSHPTASAAWIAHDEKTRQMVSGDFFELNENDLYFPRRLWWYLNSGHERFVASKERSLGWPEKFVLNVSEHLSSAQPDIREKVYKAFGLVDDELGARVQKTTEEDVVHHAKLVARDIARSKEIAKSRQEIYLAVGIDNVR